MINPANACLTEPSVHQMGLQTSLSLIRDVFCTQHLRVRVLVPKRTQNMSQFSVCPNTFSEPYTL